MNEHGWLAGRTTVFETELKQGIFGTFPQQCVAKCKWKGVVVSDEVGFNSNLGSCRWYQGDWRGDY